MKQALLVIDVQNEYITGKLPVTYPKSSFYNILKAMDAANAKQLDIVVIQHSAPQADSQVFNKGSFEWQLHPAIANRSYSVLIEKNLPGSFTNTQLESWLRERAIC
ncbi:MAG: isochorismatase family protein [Firmicutes bacterium]|nr:isochorismatase family protein [Bacillota bacterium]